MSDYSPWHLKVDHVAADITPKRAVEYLGQHAAEMGITLIGEVNGEEFMAFPDGTAVKTRARPEDQREPDA